MVGEGPRDYTFLIALFTFAQSGGNLMFAIPYTSLACLAALLALTDEVNGATAPAVCVGA